MNCYDERLVFFVQIIMTYRELTKSGTWSVSTVKNGYPISAMFDDKIETYWQSDSFPPHAIIVQFVKSTFIRKINIFCAVQTDDTFSPSELIIQTGNDPTAMVELKKVELCMKQGWDEIEVGVSTLFLKIIISKNFKGGKDCRIRQLKLFGAPYSPCIDSSVCFISPNATQYLAIR